jgi:O-antigen ligase
MQFTPSQVSAAFDKRLATFQNLEEEKSYMIRQLMIQKGLRLFEDSPIIGVGASRFTKETITLEIPQVLAYGTQSHFNIKSAHNSYVAVLAETGLIGSVPFLILLIILGIRGLKATVKQVRKGRVVVLSVFTSFVGMSIHMWTMATLTNTANWFVYGLLAAVIMINQREDSSEG